MNERMYELGAAPSAIRALFAYGLERKQAIGEQNVFDFSLGNPSVPAPPAIADAMREALELPPMAVQSPSPVMTTTFKSGRESLMPVAKGMARP